MKPITEFPQYLIDNSGNVFSMKRKKLLKKQISGNGYPIIYLYDGEKPNRRYIHRLVAEAFIPNPENKATVNHKDGNKQNNHWTNLEWNSYSENNKHAYDIGTKKPVKHTDETKNAISSKKRHLNDLQIRIIRKLIIFGMNYTQIGRMFNASRRTVRDSQRYDV
jgi:DNA-binding transcriptional regulator YiaG